MTTAVATSIGLNSSWLDYTPTPTYTNVEWTGDNITGTNVVHWWPYQQTYYYPWYVPCFHPETKPIKLAMSEVARLRSAAQKDAKLKAILAKFTDLIEVTVDFD